MKKCLDKEQENNLIDLYHILSYLTPEQVYEDQEFYLTLLKLVFNKQFKDKINQKRKLLNIPENWYGSLRQYSPEKEYEDWRKLNPNAPTKPTDKTILELCGEFDLDPLRYGWFLLNHLFFGGMSVGKKEADGLVPKGEFSHQARFAFSINKKAKNNSNSLNLYIQIYKDTTPKGLETFFRENEAVIREILKNLSPYPHKRVMNQEICKRDIVIFLLSQLDFSSGEIGTIISNPDRFNPKLSQKIKNILGDFYFQEISARFVTGRNTMTKLIPTSKTEKEYYEPSDGTIRYVVSTLKKELGC